MLEKGKLYETLPEEILRVTLNFEGGFQKNKNDTGNYLNGVLIGTNRGITPGALLRAMKNKLIPEEPITEAYMKSLSIEKTRIIYSTNYYIPSKADKCPYPLNLIQFDTAVLHGVGGASKFLQKGILESGYSITVDGAIGQKTLTALNESISEKGIDFLCDAYLDARYNSYLNIIKNSPKKKVFLNGWRNRVNKLRSICNLSTI